MIRPRVLAVLLLVAACGVSDPETLTRVPLGTWGGANAGLLVSESQAHAHIGCTLGEVPGSIPLDGDGRFDVSGQYNIDAFPVDRGIRHPARFSGHTDGHTLTLLVRLTDTGQTFGPVGLTLGQQPSMQNCPICQLPGDRLQP